ncbi:alpha/beta fold hydrolase [Clostridium folliculivorans]|uniref:Ndr family protein n=1 Tax=Clostridium folliculivorans TaxID=2886038 RepID=A0A9W5Y4E2_9CLOT|nr:alpha/beta hydrolase [Clostridium folliculivorans]GKU26362.1 Ndr family protein [Clostridium folliculivorans]GKU32083.1 Ndr family protein [Clostridium folliculivorans]
MKTAFKSNIMKKQVIEQYDKILKASNLNYEELYIDTNYGSTFIIASGKIDSPPLILLHGAGMNSAMWVGDIGEYSKNYRVYAIDIPGDPGKSDERQFSLKSSAYSDWLYAVLNSLSISTTSIIGISLGAWLSIKFAVNYPNRVDKLILISPSGIGPQKTSFMFKAILHSLQGEKGMEKLYTKVNGNKPIPTTMLKYQKIIRKSFNFRYEPIPIFSDEALLKLKMPLALFVGDKDIMLHSIKTADRLKTLLPKADINFLMNTGHAITNIKSDIIDFLTIKH